MPILTTITKAAPKVLRTTPIVEAKTKKPLGPRPRPRGESYQAMQHQEKKGGWPRAQEHGGGMRSLPGNEGSPTNMEVEFYWNRNPAGLAKPKPPPPRLMEQFLAARQAAVGRPQKKEWEPPTPPALETRAEGRAPIVPTGPRWCKLPKKLHCVRRPTDLPQNRNRIRSLELWWKQVKEKWEKWDVHFSFARSGCCGRGKTNSSQEKEPRRLAFQSIPRNRKKRKWR